jgi:cysteinyl-tRNA synthetase
MYGEAVRERARDIYETRRRSDPDFALWKRKHRKIINWDMKLGELSLSNLAFLDDIHLV